MKLNFNLYIKAKLLIIATTFFRIALGLQLPILYVYVLDLGGNLTHLGVLFAIYGVVYAVASFIISLYFLKYSQFFFSSSFLLWAIYALLMYLAHDPEHVYLLQFIAGVSTAFGKPGLVEILILNTSDAEYTKTYGLYKLIGSVLGALAASFSGFVGHYYMVRPLFLVMAVLSVISFLLSLTLVKYIDSDFLDKRSE